MSAGPRLSRLVDEALGYRGFVTIVRRDGTRQLGFVYDRGATHLELFDEAAANRVRIALDEIHDVELMGVDCAAQARRRWSAALDRRASAATPPVLILVGLELELASVARALGARVDGAAARGSLGSGSAVARAAGVGGGAAQAIASEQPGLVISCGFSGALDPSLATGAVVLAASIEDELGTALAAPAGRLRAARRALEVGAAARVAVGEIVCATDVAASRADKQALARPGRLAVDLESGPAARAAARAGVPFLAVRVILDPLELELPAFTRAVHRSHVALALRYALGGPRRVLELAALARRARLAGAALAGALRRLGPALAGLARQERRP